MRRCKLKTMSSLIMFDHLSSYLCSHLSFFSLLHLTISYHLLPSCTCFTWFFDPYVKQSTGMAQAMPSLRGRAHYSLCQPMGGAVCRGLPVSVNCWVHNFNYHFASQGQQGCAQGGLHPMRRGITSFNFCVSSWFSITDLHKDLQETKTKTNFAQQIQDRLVCCRSSSAHIPELLTSCPTMPPRSWNLEDINFRCEKI